MVVSSVADLDAAKYVEKARSIANQWQSPPTDLYEVSEMLGVAEVEEKPLQVWGMTVPVGRGYKIVLRADTSPLRKRFSWAHELGHVIVYTESDSADTHNSRRNDKLERLCDQLAAEILMPIGAFSGAIQQNRSLCAVTELSQRYQASITATALRYAKLITEPCLLIRWDADSRRNGALKTSWPVPVRNEATGPHVQLLPQRRRAANKVFSGVETAWSRSDMATTYETLLMTARVGHARYTTFPEFKTESMGFGRDHNRFVLSLVYLNDRKP